MMSQAGGLTQGPEAIETADLHFKSLSKLKVFDTNGLPFNYNTNLLAVSQHCGLVFIGTNNGFLILKSKHIYSANNSNRYHQKEVLLNSRTSHLGVDFEQTHLAVGCQTKMGPIVYIYDIPSIMTKGVSPMKTVPLSKPFQNPVIQLSELMWQPNTSSGLTVGFSDGSVSSFSFFQGSGNDMFSLPNTIQARCFCWSPKGKQLVIGSSDGTLSQYKPDLKFIKKLPSPPLFNGAVSVVNVLWISSFQFAAAYTDQQKPEEFPVVVIVNAPKNEPVKFVNYDDITYGSAFYRNHQFYFCHQNPWNIILVASANSVEVAVLHGKEDNSVWEQWLLGDASRAELPLNADKVETFPVGIAIDYTSDEVIPWGEDSLPPAPRLLLLSSEGLLTTFNIVNTCQGIPQLCSLPKENFDDSCFTVKEQNTDWTCQSKMSQPSAEASLSQTSPAESPKLTPMLSSNSAFLPPPSIPFSTQPSLFTSVQPTNFISQSSKEQTVFPASQVTPDRQAQTLTSQQPFQANAVPVSSNENSSIKWTEKPSFLFPFNTSADRESGNSQISNNKDNEFVKNTDQNSNSFSASTVQQEEPIKFTDEKANSGFKKEPVQIIKSCENGDMSNTSSPAAFPAANQNNQLPAAVAPNLNAKQIKKFKTSPSRGAADIFAVPDKIYVTALIDEIDHFNAEMKDVFNRISALRFNIGSEEEKLNMRKTIEKLNDFEKSLHDTTSCQKDEINSVQSDVIEAFAWLEDARSRNRQRKSRTFISLKKSENLDPMSSLIMSEIFNLKYYIENQLKQLHSYLMKEWMDHENNCRLDIKSTMVFPSLEELYKTMHLELKILSNLRVSVEELKQRMAGKNNKARSQTALVTGSPELYSKPADDSNRMSELYKLADNLLKIKIDRDEVGDYINVTDTFQLMLKNQVNEIAERSKKFTVSKQNILRDTFCEREMMKTRSVKSKIGSSSFIRNSSSKIYAKYLEILKKNDAEETLKLMNDELGLEVENETPQILPLSKSEAEEIIPEKSGNESKVEPTEVPVSVALVPSSQEPSTSVFGFGTLSSSTKPGIANTKEVTIPSQASTNNSSSSENQTSKAAPFVFKVSPIFSFGTSGSQSTKPLVVTSGTSLTSGNVQVVSAPPSSSTTPVFSFKAADVSTVASVAPTFSFSTVKTSSAFTPKTCTSSSSSSTTEVPATASESSSAVCSDVKTSTTASTTTPVFSFSSFSNTPVSSTPATTASTSIFKFPTSTSSVFKFTSAASTFSFASPFNSSKTNTGDSTFSFATPTLQTPFGSKTTSEAASPSTNTVTVSSKSNVSSFKSFSEANKETHAENMGTAFGLGEMEAALTTTGTTTSPTTTITTTTTTVLPITATSDITITSVAVSASSDIPVNGEEKSDAKEEDEHSSELTAVEATPEECINPGKTETSAITISELSQQSTAPIFTGASATSNVSVGSTSSTTLSFGMPGKSIFQQTIASTASSIFSNSSSNIFSSAKPVTTSIELFSTSTSTTAPSSSIFGQSVTITTTTSTSPFSQATPTTTTASFAQSGKDELGQTTTLFGGMLRSGLSSGSVFETPSTSAEGNIFGKSSFDKSGSSIFGNTGTAVTTAPATTGLFETNSSNIFMKSFGQNPSSTSTNLFGQPQTASNTFFGQNICSSFGSTTTTATNQNLFGNQTGFNSRPVFDQGLFGQNKSEQNPLERSSTTNIFASSSPSGSSGGNIFQMGSSSFSNSPPRPFSGGQSISSPTSAFQKPLGGFGGSSVFGSGLATTAAFGAPPTFGASTFGSPPSFGSSQKIFGSPQGTFGQNQGHSTNFEALANETTVGFADLAQRNQGQTFGGNTFNQGATFESEPRYGGESFSGWRS